MFLLILFIGVLILVFVNNSAKVKPRCQKQHKWVIRFNPLDSEDKRGYLICKECGKLPGEE